MHKAAAGADDSCQAGGNINDPAAVLNQRRQLCARKNTPLEGPLQKASSSPLRRLLDAVVVRDSGVVDEKVERVITQPASV